MNKDRKEDKIQEIERYIKELEILLPKTFEEYKSDYGKKSSL